MRQARFVPIWSRLALGDDVVARLRAAPTVAVQKQVLREAHDSLMAVVRPRLETMRADGRIVDFASSVALAEVVVHAPRPRVAEVSDLLAALKELRDVTSDERVARKRLRQY